MKKVYIAINKYFFGCAEVVSIGEDAHVFGVTSSPIFGNRAIPAFHEFQEEEFMKQYKERYGEVEIVLIRDFNCPQAYKDVLTLYENNQKTGQEA